MESIEAIADAIAADEAEIGEEALAVDDVLESLSREFPIVETDEPADQDDDVIEVNKQAIYDAQEGNIGLASEEDSAEVIPIKSGRSKRYKRPSKKVVAKAPVDGDQDVTPGTVKVARSTALLKRFSTADLERIGLEAADIPAVLEAMDTAPLKVREKMFNLLAFCLGRDRLSNFTKFTIETIQSHGSMTVPTLVNHMQGRYQPGTARSQSQQMTRMFRLFGMDGGPLGASRVKGWVQIDPEAPLSKACLQRLALA
jgi:hypothetical protein